VTCAPRASDLAGRQETSKALEDLLEVLAAEAPHLRSMPTRLRLALRNSPMTQAGQQPNPLRSWPEQP